MEYIYELNLPSVDSVFLETFNGFNDNHLSENYQYRTDINQIVRPEWEIYQGIKWDHLLYFKKLNSVGQIHTDIKFSLLNTPIGQNSTPWGITWVYNGDGIQEYWNFEDVKNNYVTNGSCNNSSKGVVLTYTSDKSPIKTYNLKAGKCYLVNGRLPHRATGIGARKVISLRASKHTYNVDWTSIVSQFSNIILQ